MGEEEQKNTSMIEKILPVRMTSIAIRGFGRGSKDLGIPTANLDCDRLKMVPTNGIEKSSSSSTTVTTSEEQQSSSLANVITYGDFPTGIYWGFCRIGEKMAAASNGSNPDESKGAVFKAAISIGYNPTYGNEHKTIEPHLIAPVGDPRRNASHSGETILQDFYDQPIRLSVVGYLRPELPFEGLEKLVQAIKNDIAMTEKLADASESMILAEKDWVASESTL